MNKLLLLAALFASASALADDRDLTVGLDQVALDGSGRILAFSKAWSDKLAVYENDRWREVPLAPADKPSAPRGLLTRADGRVAAVWNSGKDEWLLTVLDGDRIARKIPFAWPLDSWADFEMSGDSHGRIWLSGGLAEVVRCDPSTGEVRVFDLAPLAEGPPKERWNTVHLTEDLRGGLWLWTSTQADNHTSLPGPVRVNGDAMELVPKIPGYTGKHLVQLRARDKDSFWLATRGDGLFTMNLDTLSATRVAEPAGSAVRFFGGIFPFEGTWLVLGGTGSRMGLWQLADEKWTRRLEAGEVRFLRWNKPGPAYTELESGAVLALENGILFVPRGGGGVKVLDWRNGWTLGGVGQFLPLGGDRFAALSRGGNPPRWAVADLRDYLQTRPLSDTAEILPWRAWAVDGQDRVFTLLEEKAAGLDVWENGSWRKIPFPEGLKSDRLSHVEIDARGNVWVFSEDLDAPVGILSPDLKTWGIEPDYRAALIARAADIDGFAAGLWWLRPVTGPDGQIAFRTQNWEIVHLDGRSWKTWKLQDIGTFADGDRVSTPFFDDGGRLCVNTLRTDKTWKLGGDGRWTPEDKLPGIEDMWTNNKPRHTDRKLPDGFVPQDIRSPYVATDNLGMTWVAGNGNLFKHYKGRTVAVFDGSAMHPFMKNPPIHSVRVDRFGNAWLQLGIDSIRHAMIPARPYSPPDISLLVDRWGAVSLRAPAENTVEWRLDGGDWRTLAPGETSLGFFPPGKHAPDFRIITPRLDLVGPVAQTVSVTVTPEKQTAHFIALLRTGPDRMRELAVTALSAQPARAIPALEASIAREDSWWLQAALQECERQAAKAAGLPPRRRLPRRKRHAAPMSSGCRRYCIMSGRISSKPAQ